MLKRGEGIAQRIATLPAEFGAIPERIVTTVAGATTVPRTFCEVRAAFLPPSGSSTAVRRPFQTGRCRIGKVAQAIGTLSLRPVQVAHVSETAAAGIFTEQRRRGASRFAAARLPQEVCTARAGSGSVAATILQTAPESPPIAPPTVAVRCGKERVRDGSFRTGTHGDARRAVFRRMISRYTGTGDGELKKADSIANKPTYFSKL